MSETSTLIGYSGRTIGREELALVPTPPATETHRPIPHHEIVQALIETLGFRHIGVVHDEYAVSPDGMKMFGVLAHARHRQIADDQLNLGSVLAKEFKRRCTILGG